METEWIKREEAVESVFFAMVMTGYQSLAVGAVKCVPSYSEEELLGECWISVMERLPKDENRVLVVCKTKKGVRTINFAYYADGMWHGQGSMFGVTHWMPRPALPKEDEQ